MTESAGKKDLAWLRQTSSFAVSRIILTANNYRVFDHLQGKGKTAGNLAKSVSADSRAAELLLNSLLAAGLLVKKRQPLQKRPSCFKVSGQILFPF